MSLSRLYGDILTLGGNNNIAGKIEIKDINANVMAILDSNGLTLQNGAKLIGGNGVLSNFQFNAKPNLSGASDGGFGYVGFQPDMAESKNVKTRLDFDVYLPQNFSILEAKILLYHFPLHVYNDNNKIAGWGYARNLRLYKATSLTSNCYRDYFLSEYSDNQKESYTEISGAFGSGYTPSAASDNNHRIVWTTSTDIKNYLENNITKLKIESGNNPPSYSETAQTFVNCALQSGMAKAVLNIIGFMK